MRPFKNDWSNYYTEEELKVIQKYYSRLSNITRNEESLQTSHSIDEAQFMADVKKEKEAGIINKMEEK